jgi:replicative DNA helicase
VSDLGDRLPPQDLTAEQATLGACMIEGGAVLRAREIVSADDFYREAHQRIFGAICEVDDTGDPVDAVTVAAVLREREQLAAVGGGAYLTRVIGEVPTTAHVIRYATIVREAAVRRRAIIEASEVQASAYQDADAKNVVAEALGRFQALGDDLSRGTGAEPVRKGADALARRVEDLMTRPPGIYGPRTGIGLVDALMGGMAGQHLVLVRALTKGFKSIFGGQVVGTTARHYRDSGSGRVVLAYLLEARETWEQRMLAWLGGFDGRLFVPKPGRTMPVEHEIEGVQAALDEYRDLPLMLTSDLNEIGEIELDVRNKAARHDVGFVLVDHLHRIRNRDETEMRWSLWNTARRLARLSDSLGIPVLCLAQAIRRQDGEWYTKESSSVDDEVTLLFEIRRGDDGMERHKWQGCDWFRFYCPTGRNEQPFDGIVEPPLYCDLRRGDLRMMDERQWIERGHPTAEQQRKRQKFEAERSAGYGS